MKINKDQLTFGTLIALLFFVIILMNRHNQQNVRKVENKIDTLAAQLLQVNALTRSVTENLKQTISLIGVATSSLENSSRQLDNFLKEAGNVTGREKEKIKKALANIDSAKKSLEEERIKALKLIDELNVTKNDPQ
jgi:DNA repair exonuclease SbcCD ATPase subunit